ncbi:hypothetical protein N431DRAFT_222240 [Stipitochalara longipes BDJ]|nr:hypothetical protein N431DRAFT_222240 [Stipitochalara longipes BDJ]
MRRGGSSLDVGCRRLHGAYGAQQAGPSLAVACLPGERHEAGECQSSERGATCQAAIQWCWEGSGLGGGGERAVLTCWLGEDGGMRVAWMEGRSWWKWWSGKAGGTARWPGLAWLGVVLSGARVVGWLRGAAAYIHRRGCSCLGSRFVDYCSVILVTSMRVDYYETVL